MFPISKRRAVTTTIGLILAIAIIFSSITLSNNMAKYTTYEEISASKYHIDITASISAEKFMDAYEKIKNITNVVGCDAYFVWSGLNWSFENETLSLTTFTTPRQVFMKILQGEYPKNEEEIMVSREFADEFNISLNTALKFWVMDKNEVIHNYSFKVVGIYEEDIEVSYSTFTSSYGGFEYYDSDVYLLPATLKKVAESASISTGTAEYFIKVNTDYLMKSSDNTEIMKKLSNIEYKAYDILYADGAVVVNSSIIVEPVTSIFMLVMGIMFSLPVIIMGIYLTKVGMEIELYERRREFGVLRIRGASRFHRFKFVLIEGVIYAVIGGLVGYGLGEFISGISNSLFFHLPYFYYDVDMWYPVGGVIASLVLFFLALYSPWQKVKNTSILELISHYSESLERVEYKITKDLVLALFFWVYLLGGLYLIQNANFEGGLNIFTILAIIVIITFGLMFPIVLVVLPLTTSRLLTLGTQKVYGVIANALSKIFKVSGDLATRSLKRAPKRAAYLAFILAFILTLSSFMSITLDSENRMMYLSNIASVGGDFKIYVTNTTELKQVLSNKTLVKSVDYVSTYEMSTFTVALTDFSNYSKTVYDLQEFIKEGTFEKSGIGITWEYAKAHGISVGDVVYVVDTSNTPRAHRVSFIAYKFPGIDADVMINSEAISFSNATIALVKSANPTLMKERLDDMDASYKYIKNSEAGDFFEKISAFIDTILVYLIILGAAAIFVVQYSLYLNRRSEIALYKVRGAKNYNVSFLLLVEGGTVILLSLIIGLSTGFILAYVVISLQTINTYLPNIFTLGEYFAISTIALVGFYFLAQYILSLIFSRVKVDYVIRSMGGEM